MRKVFFGVSALFGFCSALRGGSNPFSVALQRLKLTANQKSYMAALNDPSVPLIICTGPAGTGKTSLAVLHALSRLKSQSVSRIVLTRPSVLLDCENFGALPGGIEDKTAPLFRHIREIASQTEECLSAVHNVLREKAVDIIPVEYLRGLTFQDCIVLADEAQNMTPRQMKALLTRLGKDSKLIICGDVNQSDLEGRNGLQDILERFSEARHGASFDEDGITLNSIKVVEMCEEDVKRSALVKMILGLYTRLT